MPFQGGTFSFRTGLTWPGLCQAGLHNCPWNTGLVFVPVCHCHYWQQGNAQCSCVWRHALLSHFVVFFCGYEFLETKPEFPIFCSPWGLRISHSSKQWPFCQSWAAIFSHPVGFVSLPLPAHTVCLGSRRGLGMCPACPIEQMQEGAASEASCPRHLCGRLQMPPLELRKCMLVASQVATAERRETQQLRHSLLLLHTLRRYF